MDCSCPSLLELPILVAVFLYFVGDLMVMMTGVPYVTYGACLDYFHNATSDFCIKLHSRPGEEDQIQGRAALLQMSLHMFSTIPPLLLAVYFGSWSDINGRKFPMLIPHFGNCVAVVLFLLADHLHGVKVTWIVMAGFLVRALSGQTILIRLMSYSYIADRLEERQLELGGVEGEGVWMRFMARLQVAESLGTVVGSLAGWGVQVLFSSTISFCTASVIHVIAVLLIISLLRDTAYLPSKTTRPVISDKRQFQRYREELRTLFSCSDPPVDKVYMWGCCLIIFWMYGVREGRGAITVVYVQKAPLSWPNDRLAAYTAAANASSSIFLFLLAPFLRDRTVIAVSLLCSVGGGVWMGVAVTTWGMFMGGSLAHITDCTFPAVRAILSRQVQQAHMGKILSRISAAEALSTVVGPLLLGSIYDATVDTFVEAAFLFSAAVPAVILVASAVVAVCYKPCDYTQVSTRDTILVESADETMDDKNDLTKSLIVASSTSGYGVLWKSAEW